MSSTQPIDYERVSVKIAGAINRAGRIVYILSPQDGQTEPETIWDEHNEVPTIWDAGISSEFDRTIWDAIAAETETKGVVGNYEASQIDGSQIQVNDKQVIIHSNDIPFTINTSMSLRDSLDNAVYEIEDVDIIGPGPIVIAYILQCRN